MGNKIGRAIKSRRGSNLGESDVHVHGFGSVVDSAIRTASNAGTDVYSFSETVDNPMRSSGAPNNRHVHVHGFDWVVDNAMRSSGIDESVHGFASAVDNGIMSSNLEVSASALVDVHNLSPNGSGWQKGDFLGNGSFGTVYEGFTESVYYYHTIPSYTFKLNSASVFSYLPI